MTQRSDRASVRVVATNHPPAYIALDLWQALDLPTEEFDDYFARNGWATTWASLLDAVKGTYTPCGQDAGGEPCVLRPHDASLPHYGAGDVGTSEPLPSATQLDSVVDHLIENASLSFIDRSIKVKQDKITNAETTLERDRRLLTALYSEKIRRLAGQ
jgi:hypothetical protein